MSTPAIVYEELQKLAPSAIIELYQLDFTEDVNGVDVSYYFHDGTNELKTDIIFNGISYAAYPVEVEGFADSGKGVLPRPSIKIANPTGGISAILSQLNPLNGKFTRIQTCKKFLDAANFSSGTNSTADTTAIFNSDDIWYIDRVASENIRHVEFELVSKLELRNLRIPRRSITEHCPWEYRSTECGYTGQKYHDEMDNEVSSSSEDFCGKTLNSCQARFGTKVTLPIGGFPGSRIVT